MEQPPHASFGQWLKQRRKALDLTQEALAELVGCATETLRKYEADKVRPSKQIAERLATQLAIPPEDHPTFVRLARSIPQLGQPAPSHQTPDPLPGKHSVADLSGQMIKGYDLQGQIGSGGFGMVYRAYQPLVGREVAIKIILPLHANHPEFIRRFEVEAQLVARLEHPHIVPLYDYWRDPTGAYLVMRYIRGGSLHTALERGPLSLETSAHILDHIAAALTFAHRLGVVHRDLKPANILLDEEGNAYLADFGIAKDLGNLHPIDPTLSHTIMGTLDYLAPEQIRDESITARTDLYSLGLLLYQMLMRAKPFGDGSPAQLLHKQLHEPLPRLRIQSAGVADIVNDVIQKATAKDPLNRYPDALSLAEDFRRAVTLTPAAPSFQPDTAVLVPRAGAVEVRQGSTSPSVSPIAVGDAVAAPDLLVVENPYKGLRPFHEADTADFFGREALTQHLLECLAEEAALVRFLAVVGPSGSGKSSVVRAGLIPALRRGALPNSEHWFIVDILPGADPLEELEAALLRVAVNPPTSLLHQLREDDRGLLRAVKRVLPSDSATELVLIIDQFEELFTLVQDEAIRTHVLKSLYVAVTDPRSRLRLIITLRADFYDRPLLYPGFCDLMRQRIEVIVPLTPEELHQAIVNPARRVSLMLEPDLVATILADVGEQPGALPLLQYALTELFERRQGRKLTLEAYRASGGLLGALVQRAEEIYNGLNDGEQTAARQLFLRLITPGEGVEDTRRRVPRTELASVVGDGQLLEAVTDAYGKYRLLTFDHDPATRTPTVEVAHEALLRTWGRLHEWLDTSREDLRLQRRLATALTEWINAGHDPSFLMSGVRLEQFAAWAAEPRLALSREERDYLDASLTERDRQRQHEERRIAHEAALEQRSRNVLRALVGVLALATVLALALTLFALNQSQVARQNAAEAIAAQQQARQEADTCATAEAQTKRQLVVTNAQRLGLASQNLAPHSPETALLLAYEAVARDHNPLTEQALRDALDNAIWQPTVLSAHTDGVLQAAFSPDGQRILTVSRDKTARLWDLSGRLLATCNGHTDRVIGGVFSPDGQHILTASFDKSARLWDLSGRQLAIFRGHADVVQSAEFSPDGQHILTASADQTARLWDLSGQLLTTFRGHTDALTGAVFSPDGQHILTASIDKTARLWDLSGRELVMFKGHSDQVQSAVFSPDGQHILTASFDTTARLWDLSGQLWMTFQGHSGPVRSAVFSPDGQRVLTAAEDNTARLWDMGGETLTVYSAHTDRVIRAEFSPDGQRVLTASVDQTARMWDVSGKQLAIFSHTGRVFRAAFSPDGQRVLTASFDKTARLWRLADPALVTLKGHSDGVIQVRFSPDGQRILTVSRDKTARLWDLSGKQLVTFKGHTELVESAAFSPDGQRIVTASRDKTARVWDLSGRQLTVFHGHTGGVFRAEFSPDGQRIVTASRDKTARVWDLSGELLATLSGHTDELTVAEFSPDGQRILTAAGDEAARLWDLSGQLLATFHGHTDRVTTAVFSPDGQRVLTASFDNTARLWDLSGRELVVFKGHTDRVIWIAFSPDGRHILTASRDTSARLWDVSGKQLAIFSHTGRVLGAVFSPKGDRILTTSADTTARLWDLTGKQLVLFRGDTDFAESAVFSPNEERILIASNDGTVRQYLVDVNDVLAIAACRVGRGLTDDEIAQFEVGTPHFDITKRRCPAAVRQTETTAILPP